jgi:hypothetical protein
MVYVQNNTAARLPGLADPSTIPDDELDDYEVAIERVQKYSPGNPVADARMKVDGQPYALPYWTAWTHTPRLLSTLLPSGQALVAIEGLPGHIRQTDHELIDLVIGFDTGYWGLHAGHTPNAIAAGVRVEAIEALADGREDLLTDDERQQVEFIRAVHNGGMTDDIWNRMVERLGSVRGAIEFAYFVCNLITHHRMMWAFGVPAVDESEWRAMIAEYKSGRRNPLEATQDYARASIKRTSQGSD